MTTKHISVKFRDKAVADGQTKTIFHFTAVFLGKTVVFYVWDDGLTLNSSSTKNVHTIMSVLMFSKHLKNRYVTFAIKQPLWPKAVKLQSLLKWYKFKSLFTYDCSKLLRSFTIAGQNELTSCVTILLNGFAMTWRLLTNVPFYIIVNYCLKRHSDLYIAVTPAEGTLQKKNFNSE